MRGAAFATVLAVSLGSVACSGSEKHAARAASPTALHRNVEAWAKAMRKIRAARDARELALLDLKDTVDAPRFQTVIAAYDEAAAAWGELAKVAHEAKDEGDEYEAGYFLAEAKVNAIELSANLWALGAGATPPPSVESIEEARDLAARVRDHKRTDHLFSAALLAVKIADVSRDIGYAEHQKSRGLRGIELRDQPEMQGARPKVLDLPRAIEGSIEARHAFIRKVPADADADHAAPIFRAWVGRTLFVYGRFADARAELEPLLESECGKSPSGYVAWITLMQLAALSSEVTRAGALADAARTRSCAMGDAQKKEEGEILDSLDKALHPPPHG